MIAFIILGTVFFIYLAIKLHAGQTWRDPETYPCEDCLRWGECHGVELDGCPFCTDWRGE